MVIYKVSQPALRECTVISHFFCLKKDVTFSLIRGPVMGFPSEHIAARQYAASYPAALM